MLLFLSEISYAAHYSFLTHGFILCKVSLCSFCLKNQKT